MSNQYITAEEQLPDVEGTETETEIELQVRDAETKEIFHSRARIARDPAKLDRPEPLSVVKGPHENTEEQWYIEFVDGTNVDGDRLERLVREQRERSNVINTRSDDLNVLLRYLVEDGQYESTAAAARELLFDRLAAEYPSLLERYADARAEYENDPLRDALEGE
ncbi:ubiD operon protein [Natronorubrum sp. JWXQ-INN-674]|uniref:UbiD operon protein n=1 Tax=Natronorubrum halalkaliphilum TaxID=2691917 RepID=A0A6B0VQC5_9EURY|nr:ubiD operon protein [Natronorubrum halalkaliphilum]MXV62982.1 ubiD operon protein [Natronorubrum halalkaliphilum]